IGAYSVWLSPGWRVSGYHAAWQWGCASERKLGAVAAGVRVNPEFQEESVTDPGPKGKSMPKN
ncbi:MAG: hypothetical protein RL513_605, partial [Pseudomonadota bacterium]